MSKQISKIFSKNFFKVIFSFRNVNLVIVKRKLSFYFNVKGIRAGSGPLPIAFDR